MDDFIPSQGIIWLPHILRRLMLRMVEASDAVLADHGVTVPSKMVSVVHLLYDRGPQAIMQIASVTCQSHPLINKYVRQLKELGLATTAPDEKDKRRTIVSLTRAGEHQAAKLLEVRQYFVPAYLELMREADADVFAPLWRIEEALAKTPFADRIRAVRDGDAKD